jgi:transcription initiation factor TFIIIB Brf1 subunit/transcription initiation factor TFIIB
MSRANPFGNLDDFAPQGETRPVAPEAIDKLAQASGFPSRKAQGATPSARAEETPSPTRRPRRHVTGRNRQINIKATEETIDTLYRIADDLGLPLGAVLEQALTALEKQSKS